MSNTWWTQDAAKLTAEVYATIQESAVFEPGMSIGIRWAEGSEERETWVKHVDRRGWFARLLRRPAPVWEQIDPKSVMGQKILSTLHVRPAHGPILDDFSRADESEINPWSSRRLA